MHLEHQELSDRIIGAAIQVHWTLGPGFLESIYELALCLEIRKRGIHFVRQHNVQIFYDSVRVGKHELDLFVEDEMVVELKTVKAIDGAHFAKVRSYLRAVNRRHGLILNFALPKLEIRLSHCIEQAASWLPHFLHSSLKRCPEDDDVVSGWVDNRVCPPRERAWCCTIRAGACPALDGHIDLGVRVPGPP